MISNKRLAVAAILVISIIMMMPVAQPQDVPGTRQGEVGWQYDTFTENLIVNVTPETITTMDQIAITIDSIIPDVWISQASLYGVVYPADGFQFPISYPFFKVDNDAITFRCVIDPFSQFSSYDMEFYIVVYDYFNTPMDSRSSNIWYEYSATGSGWKHDAFDENIELTYWPMRVNATEEVEIVLKSIDNITINGANLWMTFESPEGQIEEGGWNFSKTNANSTEMKQTIPGYPAGTNITFWVIAWDQYNAQTVSRFYNYSVIGIVEYTDFPFEYSDVSGNKDVWVPDDVITLSMAGMCALGIPLFIYLYAITIRRLKRADELIVNETGTYKPDTEELPENITDTDSLNGETDQSQDTAESPRATSAADSPERNGGGEGNE